MDKGGESCPWVTSEEEEGKSPSGPLKASLWAGEGMRMDKPKQCL